MVLKDSSPRCGFKKKELQESCGDKPFTSSSHPSIHLYRTCSLVPFMKPHSRATRAQETRIETLCLLSYKDVSNFHYIFQHIYCSTQAAEWILSPHTIFIRRHTAFPCPCGIATDDQVSSVGSVGLKEAWGSRQIQPFNCKTTRLDSELRQRARRKMKILRTRRALSRGRSHTLDPGSPIGGSCANIEILCVLVWVKTSESNVALPFGLLIGLRWDGGSDDCECHLMTGRCGAHVRLLTIKGLKEKRKNFMR